MLRFHRFLGLTLAAGAGLIMLAGCEDESADFGADSSPVAETTPKTDQPSQGTTTIQGGGSALGGAKRAAGNVVEDVQQRSNQLPEDLDD